MKSMMRNSYAPQNKFSSEIIAEQAAAHAYDMDRLDDLAAMFLSASNGDRAEAERHLDTTVDLLLEGGTVSLWRYRVLLGEIREGAAR